MTKDKSAIPAEPGSRLKRKAYEKELRLLHGELVAMQEWVKDTDAKVCVVFEGRDTAGKGGTIKAITERVSPRVFRVVALPAPNERERSQMFIQRYVPHFPASGEVVIFDRSWYNRAGIERVMGFCTEDQVTRFLAGVPLVERTMVESDIILVKYWLEVSPAEQTRRLESRINDPRKVWKALRYGPQVVQPLVGLRASPKRHVSGQRHIMGPVVRRPHRRQAARPAQHHSALAQPDPVRAPRASRRHSPQAAETTSRRATPPAPDTGDPDTIRLELALSAGSDVPPSRSGPSAGGLKVRPRRCLLRAASGRP